MINNVVLVGRLTKDIELKKTNSNISTTTFTLACDRKYKTDNGTNTDFIQCVAWRQSADFLDQYAKKGNIVGVEGQIQTRSYDGQHGKVYVTEVLCDRVRLLSSNKETKNDVQEENNYANYPSTPIDTSDLDFL